MKKMLWSALTVLMRMVWSALTVSMRMWSALTVSMRMWSALTVSMRMWSALTVSMRMVWSALTVSMRIGVFVWSAVSMTLLALTWSMHSKVRWLFIFGVLLLAGYVEAADLYVPEGQGVSTESKPKIDFARLSIPFIENKVRLAMRMSSTMPPASLEMSGLPMMAILPIACLLVR